MSKSEAYRYAVDQHDQRQAKLGTNYKFKFNVNGAG